MNSSKRPKYEAVKVPVSDVIKELGDPSTWDAEDAEYERSIRQKSQISEIPMAATTRELESKRAPRSLAAKKTRTISSKKKG